MNKKWIEHNKKEFGVQITQLKKIISEQVRDGGKADSFTSDMLVAIISGRKITPKMESAINNIIKRESIEEKLKREDWLNTVLPKLMMVRNEIDKTDWSMGYRSNSDNFMKSIIEQAKNRRTLSKKQMEAVTKLWIKINKNIKKKT